MTPRDGLDRTLLLCADLVPNLPPSIVLQALLGARISIVADAPNLMSTAAQSAVVTLATLSLSMGASVELAMPDVLIRAPQPPLRGARLRSALSEFATDFMPGPAVTTAKKPTAPAVFLVGDTPWDGSASEVWRLVATAGSGAIVPVTAAVNPITGNFSLGAQGAATLAAAEVFKMTMRPLVEGALPGVVDQVSASRTARVRLVEDAIAERAVDLGGVDCVSAGAITQAFVHALLRVPTLTVSMRVIEPDRLELSNLNRYPLARLSMLRMLKAEALANYSTPRVRMVAVAERYDEALAAELQLASRVVVGTDDIPSRWLVQAQKPAWIAVGATTHFQVLCSEHTPTLACAQCLHPRDDGVRATIPTISFVSYLAGLQLLARLLRHASGIAAPPDEQATLFGTLRADGPHSLLHYVVLPEVGCPQGCDRVA